MVSSFVFGGVKFCKKSEVGRQGAPKEQDIGLWKGFHGRGREGWWQGWHNDESYVVVDLSFLVSEFL